MPEIAASATRVIRSGMACLDTSGNPRIPLLMQLVGALSRAQEPRDVIRTFATGVQDIFGPRGYVSLSTRGLAPGEYRITRLLPNATPEAIANVDSWKDRESMPVHRGGFFGELIRSAYPEIIHHFYLRDDPVVGDALAEIGSIMAIPLFDDGEPVNWAISLRKEPDGFCVNDLEEWILRSNLVGGTVKNTVMAKQLRAANEAIHREVDQIASIQRTLLPQKMPRISGVRLAASYETFDRAGGDYYDFFPAHPLGPSGEPDPDGCWGILIADASGHGPAAAVVMAMVHALVHAYPRCPDGPAEVLEHLNRHLNAKRIERSFVTAFLAFYDPRTRTLVYARAGHNPPLLLKRNEHGGEWCMERLDGVGNIPLGVLDDVTFDECSRQLEPAQTVVFYTDGITEARGAGGHMFGIEGIEQSLTVCTGEPDCAISHITSSLQQHQGSVRPDDDQTTVVMRVDAVR